MSRNQRFKFEITQRVEQTGILGEFDIIDSDLTRFVVENAGGSNEFVIRAKLKGASTWNDLLTITGSDNVTLSVDTYELLQIECTTLDGSEVRFSGSGFLP